VMTRAKWSEESREVSGAISLIWHPWGFKSPGCGHLKILHLICSWRADDRDDYATPDLVNAETSRCPRLNSGQTTDNVDYLAPPSRSEINIV
jgi:hypothetical protein